MSKKKLLLDQLACCRNVESWFKPMSIALEGLSAEQAAWRPNEMSHSIGEITQHLQYWNERWLMRYRGEALPPDLDEKLL